MAKLDLGNYVGLSRKDRVEYHTSALVSEHVAERLAGLEHPGRSPSVADIKSGIAQVVKVRTAAPAADIIIQFCEITIEAQQSRFLVTCDVALLDPTCTAMFDVCSHSRRIMPEPPGVETHACLLGQLDASGIGRMAPTIADLPDWGFVFSPTKEAEREWTVEVRELELPESVEKARDSEEPKAPEISANTESAGTPDTATRRRNLEPLTKRREADNGADKAFSGWELEKLNGVDYVTAESIKAFYRFTEMEVNDDVVTLENKSVLMKLSIGSQECYLNGVRFVLSHPVESSEKRVLVSRVDLSKTMDPVLRPNYVRGVGAFTTVIVDPAHGGEDRGETNDESTEAELTLELALLLKGELEKKGFRVVLTRESDKTVSVEERLKIASDTPEEAVFVSLSFQTGPKEMRGIQTYVVGLKGVAPKEQEGKRRVQDGCPGNAHDSENIALACAIHSSVLVMLGSKFDGGVRRGRPEILQKLERPAVVFEGGFLSNQVDAKLISNAAYMNTVARGIAAGVIKFRFSTSHELESDRAWRSAEKADTESGWIDYIVKHPDNKKTRTAIDRLRNHEVVHAGGLIPWTALGGKAIVLDEKTSNTKGSTASSATVVRLPGMPTTFHCNDNTELWFPNWVTLGSVKCKGRLKASDQGLKIVSGMAFIPIPK